MPFQIFLKLFFFFTYIKKIIQIYSKIRGKIQQKSLKTICKRNLKTINK